jgi:hypothetical protein
VPLNSADLDAHEFAHADGRVEQKLQHDLMLDVATVLNDLEEQFQVGFDQ